MSKVELVFATNRIHSESLPCPTGDEFDITYHIVLDENGHKVLKRNGKTNRYEKIQSHAEETSIEVILKKATLDPSVLNQRVGSYGDFTDMPKSLAEFQNMVIDLTNTFNSLPVDIRKQFDNSVDKFIHDAGSKEWFDILMPKADVPVVDVPVVDEKGEAE